MKSGTVNKALYDSLLELGLTRQEAELYVASLTLGPSSLADVARKTGIARPNLYKLIKGLEQGGLVQPGKKGRYARAFSVEPPTVVMEKLRLRQKELAEKDKAVAAALPELMAFYHQGEMPTKIKVLTGEKEYLQAFFQILDEAKDTCEYFGSAADFIGFTSWETEKRWIKERMQKKIFIRALLLPSKDADQLKATDEKEMRETRILHGIPPFVTSFQLFANKVILWQPKAPLAILIEDEYIVAMLRSVFYKLWGATNSK